MSEEILKALTQLFAIFSKQDNGTSHNEREFIVRFFNEELDQDSIGEYVALYDKLSGYGSDVAVKKRIAVSDSVKTLGICRKINQTLTQRQKAVVLVKIMELITSDNIITPTELEVLNTVAEVFNFSKQEYMDIENFVFYGVKEIERFDSPNVLMISPEAPEAGSCIRYIPMNICGYIVIQKIPSVNMYFLRYFGDDELTMNGFVIKRSQVYLFSNGSTVRLPSGDAVYFSEVVARFGNATNGFELSFVAQELEFTFPGGTKGLRNINIEENGGKLVGIMGSSGAGKTTLLNVLAGLEKPSSGQIRINGIDAVRDKELIRGIIGYVSQDDLLMEDLTVFQNLYYNAKLCFGNLGEEEIRGKVSQILVSLNLDHIRDLKVGNALNKKISGGQRKRLNIALELIREPAILFVDEPTSGLSSRDSENVIDLLKELSLKGKLIFVVIHQPSSEIYKMFDRMFILDEGGYPVYYGDPVEAVAYFKEISNQVDKQKGLCKMCGNVNPEQVFNIIDAKVVDEYGQETPKRKMRPEQWHEHFVDRIRLPRIKEMAELPDSISSIPSRIKQVFTYTARDFFSKISNVQYLVLNFTEAPLLAFLLAWITQYIGSKDGHYLLRYNDNLPVFFLMAIVVALFLGLTVSAEEILRDKKILKRESFLHLSWNSYLLSKLIILFSLSAIQAFSFTVIGILLLQIHGMFLAVWLLLFSVSAFANVTGLVISASFNSPVTVYILIPIILIPQMILSGLMFPYNKLNKSIASETGVPVIADLMTSRWAVEALMVDQFVNNPYEAPFYGLDQELSESDYKSAYLLDELKAKASYINEYLDYRGTDSVSEQIGENLDLIVSGLLNEQGRLPFHRFAELHSVRPATVTAGLMNDLIEYMNKLVASYQEEYNHTLDRKNKLIHFLERRAKGQYSYDAFKDEYYNEQVANAVRNLNTDKRLVIKDGKIYRVYDPVFNRDYPPSNLFNFSTEFYSATKPFLGFRFSTYSFNVVVIWVMTLMAYVALYFNLLPTLLESFSRLSELIKNRIQTIIK